MTKKKEKDYVKVKRISEKLTGGPSNIRHTSKKFKEVIEECNEVVEQILNRTAETEEQERTAKKLGIDEPMP